jgi:hypothetical protein
MMDEFLNGLPFLVHNVGQVPLDSWLLASVKVG